MAEHYLKIDVDPKENGSNGHRDDLKRGSSTTTSGRSENVVDFLMKVKHWKFLALSYAALAIGAYAYLMNYHSSNYSSEYLVKSNRNTSLQINTLL